MHRQKTTVAKLYHFKARKVRWIDSILTLNNLAALNIASQPFTAKHSLVSTPFHNYSHLLPGSFVEVTAQWLP